MNNFDRGPGRRGRGPHGDLSFVYLIIKAVIEIITFVFKSIIAVVAGSKIGDVIDKRDKNSREEPILGEKKKTEKKRRLGVGAAGIVAMVLAILFAIAAVGNGFDLLLDPSDAADLSWGVDVVLPFLLSAGAFGFFRSRKSFRERQSMYLILIGDSEYFDISALAAAASVSKRRVRRDLKKMIAAGDFGDRAYIDMSCGILFRTPEAGAEYAALHSTEKKVDNAEGDGNNSADERQAEDKVEQDEYRRIILEIRRLNDEIKDFSVSERIYRIEEHTQNIFDYVKEHPEKKEKIRTFMNYYLPTTLKLLTSYAKIERLGASGDNMKGTKEDIEKTLDMLVYAFERELDMLFESESIDISSDIDVLETMLKRDGMTRGYSDDLFAGGAAAQSAPDDTGKSDQK